MAEKAEERALRDKYYKQTGKRFRKKRDALAELRAYPFPKPLQVQEEFLVVVNREEWDAYKAFQAGGQMPQFFFDDDEKADQIIQHYDKLDAHFGTNVFVSQEF